MYTDRRARKPRSKSAADPSAAAVAGNSANPAGKAALIIRGLLIGSICFALIMCARALMAKMRASGKGSGKGSLGDSEEIRGKNAWTSLLVAPARVRNRGERNPGAAGG